MNTTENYSRQELIVSASLIEEDILQLNQCRQNYNRLGFGYQIGFVRLLNRFPTQQPLEILADLLTFVSVQLQIDENEINSYQKRKDGGLKPSSFGKPSHNTKFAS